MKPILFIKMLCRALGSHVTTKFKLDHNKNRHITLAIVMESHKQP